MKLKPEKISGLNGIRTHDLYDTGAVLYQVSYQAIFISFSAVQIYDLSYINLQKNRDQLPGGLMAQLDWNQLDLLQLKKRFLFKTKERA